jgi:hypothetical protein
MASLSSNRPFITSFAIAGTLAERALSDQDWLSRRAVERDPPLASMVPVPALFDVLHARELASDASAAAFERAEGRLRTFGQFEADWDGEGALKPRGTSLSGAIHFLHCMRLWHPEPLAALANDGCAVLEFREPDFYAEVKFQSETYVEVYWRPVLGTSEMCEGAVDSPEVAHFLRNRLEITLRS